MWKFLALLHGLLLVLFFEEVLSLWVLLPYGVGVLTGNWWQDRWNDYYKLRSSAKQSYSVR